MEAVVSLLILGILLTTIVSIIQFSLVMTGNTLGTAESDQNGFNLLVEDVYTSTPVEISFYTDSDHDLDATHLIILHNEDGTVAFRPAQDEG